MDIAIIIFIILATLVGYNRGILKASLLSVGKIISILIAYKFHYIISNFLIEKMPFITFDEQLGLKSLNIQFYKLIGFVIVFLIIYIIYKTIIILVGLMDKAKKPKQLMTIFERLGGLVVGFITGYLLTITIMLILYMPLFNIELKTYRYPELILSETPFINEFIEDRFELNKELQFRKGFKDEYDEKALENMINAEYIDKDLVMKLINNQKIEFKNSKEFLNKIK